MADLTTLSPMPDGGDVDSKSATYTAPEGGRTSKKRKAKTDDASTAAMVNNCYEQWRGDRRPYEIQWFLNAAFIRGRHFAKWNSLTSRLESRKTPSHREKTPINRILPKVRARLAKFTKTRPIPIIVAANTDRNSVMDAKATEKVLDYQWRKQGLEVKYEDALLWAMTTGKSFWWFRWNNDSIGRVKMPDSQFGDPGEVVDVPLGDLEVEGGTAFEVLVEDPGISRIAQQPRIMRIKARPCVEVEKMHDLSPGSCIGDTTMSDLFQYQKQIAEIGAKNITGFQTSDRGENEKGYSHVIVKEMFCRPNAAHEKGRYIVVAGSQVLKDEELPYDFGPEASNPYPVVEFIDILTAGQFWPTTMVEQLIGIQIEYNDMRNKVREQLKLQMHPKFLIPKQAQLHPNAYNSEAGEKIEFHFIPGMPLPAFLTPPRVSEDAWRTIEAIKIEFDDLTSIYPSSVGAPGDNGESGFQTNLLQEASDSVHAPDIRRNELSIEEASLKMRRLMAQGYDVPRLISIVGRNHLAEVFEFSQDHIDEHAHIIVQAGSALPTLKASRAKMIMEMHGAMLFGDPNDPATKRRVLGMLEIGGIDDAVDILKRDEDQARLENLDISKSIALEAPMPWENHLIHYEFHTDLLKSPELRQWSQEQRDELVRHVIMHAKFINPINAMMLAQQFGYQDLVEQITPMVQQAQAQAAQAPPPGGPGAPPGPEGPPQEAPAGPPPGGPAPPLA